MSLLVNVQSLSKSFGSRTLFKNLSLTLFSGDRLGFIGPNGSGKSTLLKIIAGQESADEGMVSPRRNLAIGYVPQTCEFPDRAIVDLLLDELKNTEKADYEKMHLVELWLSKLGFSGHETSAAKLSGGWKKRLALACALINYPDLLLLDEPTNHLDLDGVLWLEQFLLKEAPTYLLVSHDRAFLQNTTNRIVEIDSSYPEGLFGIEGSYDYFLIKKREFLDGQLEQERSIASKARRELDWLRKSPKARTTKSRSRVEDAHELLDDLAQIKMRNRPKTTDISFEATERETRKLLVAKNLTKTLGDKALFRHLDFTLSPGTRIGLIGTNGSGKTTLLRLLMGEILPDQGTIKTAENLKIVYFDQHRSKLPDNISLRDALSPNGDFVSFRGEPIHVNGWCKRFLFTPDYLDMPLFKLSGGERARLSIAHLMLQPADLLLLDEPTNDLDIPTLTILEESLQDFPGAVVLITHDRSMLENICNSFLGLGNPDVTTLYADYGQWEKAHKSSIGKKNKEKKQESAPPAQEAPKVTPAKSSLTYKEKREYENIEENILKLEKELSVQKELLEKSEINQSPTRLQEICQLVASLESEIEKLYHRMQELHSKLK